MKDYLLLIREPDGRTEPHDPGFAGRHQEHWKDWIGRMLADNRLSGGKSLTLEGRIIRPDGSVTEGLHRNGTEIVGGFLLLRAGDLDEATSLAQSCPVFEAGGYIEIRELVG